MVLTVTQHFRVHKRPHGYFHNNPQREVCFIIPISRMRKQMLQGRRRDLPGGGFRGCCVSLGERRRVGTESTEVLFSLKRMVCSHWIVRKSVQQQEEVSGVSFGAVTLHWSSTRQDVSQSRALGPKACLLVQIDQQPPETLRMVAQCGSSAKTSLPAPRH